MAGKDLRIGVVGTGAIGRTHIERINNKLQGAKVVACADVNVDFGKSVAEKYDCKFYADGEEMIASDDIDAVIVTTIDPYHEQYVMAAIKSNMYSVKNLWHLRQKPARESWRQRLQAENSLYRSAS